MTQKREEDRKKLRRRIFHSLSVLGDHLYIEGGEVSNYLDGELEGENASSTVQNTLSIPLDHDWTNSTVEFTETSRLSKMLPLTHGALWKKDNKTMYRWAGQLQEEDGVSMTQDKTQKYLWQFDADGNGGGTWSTVDPAEPDQFERLHQGIDGASVTCGEMGLYLGGYANDLSDVDFGKYNVALPGLLTYDFDTRVWSNDSTIAMYPDQSAFRQGAAFCVTGISENPLVVILGGANSRVPAAKDDYNTNDISNITIFDPVQKQWYWQKTTSVQEPGPASRVSFCAVGAQSKDNTFEIIMYGGNDELSDIWVLSLPGFVWQKVEVDSPVRRRHACEIVNSYQMISVGGVDNHKNWMKESDPWPQTIGIFDMRTLEWKDKYSSTKEDYDSPEMVKKWYRDGNKVTWSNTNVEVLFTGGALDVKDKNNTAPDIIPSASQSSSSDPTHSGSTESQNTPTYTTPKEAIAGAVIGAIGLILLVVCGFCLFHHRRKRPKQTDVQEGRVQHTVGHSVELGDNPVRHELHNSATQELHSNSTYELHSNSKYELDSTDRSSYHVFG